jgi:hypothetical protein
MRWPRAGQSNAEEDGYVEVPDCVPDKADRSVARRVLGRRAPAGMSPKAEAERKRRPAAPQAPP